MTTDPCTLPLLRLRDVPCECMPPPLQCCVDTFIELPFPPAVDIRNGDVYVVKDTIVPYFFWDGAWYPFTSAGGAGDADWFVEGVGGPSYGLGLNTDNAYHEGPIAINRTSIRGAVGVLDIEGQILSDGAFTGVPDPPATVTMQNNRFMWMPEIGAIRAGASQGPFWDAVNLGNYSAGFGLNNIASGVASMTCGFLNEATGRYSFVAGTENMATADSSIVLGEQNTATNQETFVSGHGNLASGESSTCFGSDNVASGFRSWVNGDQSESQGHYTFVSGGKLILDPNARWSVAFGSTEQQPGFPVETYSQDFSFIVHGLRPFLHGRNSAPADADIKNSHFSIWVNEVTDDLVFRVRYSTGLYKTGTVALV